MKDLRYINQFIWKYRKLLFLGIFFIIIANIFALYPAEFVRKAFDSILQVITEGESKKNIHKLLLKYGGLIISFAILKGIFMYFMRQTIIVMSRNIEYDLKNIVYKKYQALSMHFYKKNKTGDLMNRITEDVSRVRMYVGPVLMYSINMVALFSLVITKMFSISISLSLYVLMPLPILAISVYYVSLKINKKSEKVQEQLSTLTTITQETFSGIRILKSFVNEHNSIKSFIKNCKEYTHRQLDLVKIEAIFFPLIVTMIGISTILTVYIGGIESFNGNISSGNIAEFIIYVNMLAWPVASIGWVTSLIQRAAASQKRINELLQTPLDIINTTEKLTSINGDITFKNVSFSYNNKSADILNNINLIIKAGSKVGIFGKTGSGKSTLLNLICRMYDPTSGKIIIGNQNIKNLNLYNLRDSISYIPQDGYLFSGDIQENITFGTNKISKDRLDQSISLAAIQDDITKFKSKLKTLVGERGVQLSGGQKQRLAIARALYKERDIYILDDCMSAIDANKEKDILKNLHEFMKHKTVIVVSHRISTLANTDHIIVLNQGRIIEEGSHKNLLTQEGFYAKIYLEQQNKSTK